MTKIAASIEHDVIQRNITGDLLSIHTDTSSEHHPVFHRITAFNQSIQCLLQSLSRACNIDPLEALSALAKHCTAVKP